MKLTSLVSIVLLLMVTGALLAQDAPAFQCTGDDIGSSIQSIQDLLTQAQSASTGGDIEAALTLLDQIRSLTQAAESQCRGLFFQGSGTDALGPMELEAGVYIVEYNYTIEESAFVFAAFTAQLENLDKDELLFDSVLETQQEAGEFSGRKTMRVEGGRYLISLDASGIQSWTIQIVKP